MCEIWKVEEDDYINNCTKREGPVSPDLTADNKLPSSCASKNCSVSENLSSKIIKKIKRDLKIISCLGLQARILHVRGQPN